MCKPQIPYTPPEKDKIFYNTPKLKRRKKRAATATVAAEEFDAFLKKIHHQCLRRIAYHSKKLIAAANNVEGKKKSHAKPKTRVITKRGVIKVANPEITMFKSYTCGYKTKPSKIRKRKLEGTISKKEFLARSKKMIKEIRERKHPPADDQDIASDKKI